MPPSLGGCDFIGCKMGRRLAFSLRKVPKTAQAGFRVARARERARAFKNQGGRAFRATHTWFSGTQSQCRFFARPDSCLGAAQIAVWELSRQLSGRCPDTRLLWKKFGFFSTKTGNWEQQKSELETAKTVPREQQTLFPGNSKRHAWERFLKCYLWYHR